ncbi:hypothetical protein [Vibrio metschnikovii]|uniref:hypothetical protein n=1 Tax=Vibrio metschnikovii TaxID=28172 RepID=UPI0016466E47|nr:hypothetical protein [Vibrio metschnikovii]MBC3620315.1 hypothetical protein [Vibrio metschnikovii]
MNNSSNELLKEVKAHFGGGNGNNGGNGVNGTNVTMANVGNLMGVDSGANGYMATNGGTVNTNSGGRPIGSGTCTGGRGSASAFGPNGS